MDLDEKRMGYEDFIIYYMSGTGNTYRAALMMMAAERSGKTPSHVFPIERGGPKEGTLDGERSLIGLLMPTHGFTDHGR